MIEGLTYGTVRDTKTKAIYVLRVSDVLLDFTEVDQLSALMSEWLLGRGEASADVVVVQGDSKETLRLSGNPYAVNRVRAAMFNAELKWQPIAPE